MDTTVYVKCDKIPYKDKAEAIKALHRIRNTPTPNSKPIRAYECEMCNFWHLTSREIDFSLKNGFKPKLDWSKLLKNDE